MYAHFIRSSNFQLWLKSRCHQAEQEAYRKWIAEVLKMDLSPLNHLTPAFAAPVGVVIEWIHTLRQIGIVGTVECWKKLEKQDNVMIEEQNASSSTSVKSNLLSKANLLWRHLPADMRVALLAEWSKQESADA